MRKQLGFPSPRTLPPLTTHQKQQPFFSHQESVVWLHGSPPAGSRSQPPPLLYFLGQVSVLTDQVEAQGEKIRDLEVCLEGHQVKLNAAEEMLQQVRVGGTQGLGQAPFWVHVAELLLFPSCLEGRVGCLACGVYTAGETGGGRAGKGWPGRNNLLGWFDRFPGHFLLAWFSAELSAGHVPLILSRQPHWTHLTS